MAGPNPNRVFDYEHVRLRSTQARFFAPLSKYGKSMPRWMAARPGMYDPQGEWDPDRYLDPGYVAWVRAWKKPLGGTD